MHGTQELTMAQDFSISSLAIQEYDIDLLDDGSIAADVPGSSTTLTSVSTWICVSITVVSVSATAYYDCLI